MILRKLLILTGVAVVIITMAAVLANGSQSTSGHERQAGDAGQGGMQGMEGMQMPGMEMREREMSESEPNAAGVLTEREGFSTVTIAPEIQQRIGVTTAKAEVTPLVMQIRTVGIIGPNETRLAHIHLKTEGWVQRLFVSFTGQEVKAGDPLLSIYSPAFFAAQRELLVALQVAKTSPSPDQQIVVDAARRRLELWDVPKEEIESLEKTGKGLTYLTLRSPISGTVLDRKAFEGQYVTPEKLLYLVADLSTVWVQAKVYEYELPHVEVNMPVTITLPAFDDHEFTGKIAFIDPTVEEPARTVRVRIELANERGQLKPGMFSNVFIRHEMGRGLTVPSSAVIRTGQRNIVYRVEGQGQFVPVQVNISPIQFGDRYQILKGLQAQEAVVTSANFLIDSESRLRAGVSAMAGMPGMENMQMGTTKPSSTAKTEIRQERSHESK